MMKKWTLIQVLEEMVVENLPSLSVTQKDVKAMQASKYTDLSNTSDKNVSADDNVLSFKHQGDPDVLPTFE